MARDGLTPKQELFVAAYLGEARQVGVTAARMAGYQGTVNTLNQAARANLQNATIVARIAEWRADVRSSGIASLEARVSAQQERWEKIQQVIAERATLYGTVPGGGQTGLLARDVKGIGRGDDFQVVDVYSVDTALLAELRQLEMHTAKELGQWEERGSNTLHAGEGFLDALRSFAASAESSTPTGPDEDPPTS